MEAVNWVSADLGSVPGSPTIFLRDPGKVSLPMPQSPLCKMRIRLLSFLTAVPLMIVGCCDTADKHLARQNGLDIPSTRLNWEKNDNTQTRGKKVKIKNKKQEGGSKEIVNQKRTVLGAISQVHICTHAYAQPHTFHAIVFLCHGHLSWLWHLAHHL